MPYACTLAAALFWPLAHVDATPMAAEYPSEPAAVAARFLPPAVDYDTPALDARQPGWTSHWRLLAELQALALRADVRLHIGGHSVQGRPLPVVVLAEGGRWRPQRPTLMLVAQQHGDEPAAGEALLALLDRWSRPEQAALLRRINIVALPRVNPDGAARQRRSNAQNIDINRDHLQLRTPEARLMARMATRYRPQVVLDLHEFAPAHPWLGRFGGWAAHDVLLQTATIGNLPPALHALGVQELVPVVQRAVQARGLRAHWYHTSSAAPDAPVRMGDVQPDTWRNISGMRGAVSLLHETRGIGLGKAHLLRRIHAHVLAAQAVAQHMADHAPALMRLSRETDRHTIAQACTGHIVLTAAATPEAGAITLIDHASGRDKTVAVTWHNALHLHAVRTRARPCGYWLAAGQTRAVRALRALGVQLRPMTAARTLNAERFVLPHNWPGPAFGPGHETGAPDAPGAVLQTEVQPLQVRVPAGGWYISLAQPLGALVSAALEPDMPGSYVASGLLDVAVPGQPDRLLRVMQPLH